jgi:hypothetical protein
LRRVGFISVDFPDSELAELIVAPDEQLTGLGQGHAVPVAGRDLNDDLSAKAPNHSRKKDQKKHVITKRKKGNKHYCTQSLKEVHTVQL